MSYIIHRILKIIPIGLGLSLLTFSLLYLSPSDPAKMYYHNKGLSYTEEMLNTYRKEKGLDQPFLIQYKNWIQGVLQGDFGASYSDNQPVLSKILKALPYTLSLGLNALILTLVLSIPGGIYLALKSKSLGARLLSALCLVMNSLPNFILALVLIYTLAMRLSLFPILADNSVRGIFLPTLALSLSMAAKYTRQIEVISREVLTKDYIKGLKARGIPTRRILSHTVLKNLAIPLVTLVGLSMGGLLGGTVVVESIFNWPGIGKLIVDGVAARDYPLVQGIVLWMAFVYVMINIITDLSYRILDPRVRLGVRDE